MNKTAINLKPFLALGGQRAKIIKDSIFRHIRSSTDKTLGGIGDVINSSGATVSDSISSLFNKNQSTPSNVINLLKHLSGISVGKNLNKSILSATKTNGTRGAIASQIGRFLIPTSAIGLVGSEMLEDKIASEKKADFKEGVRNFLSDYLPSPNVVVVNKPDEDGHISDYMNSIGKTTAIGGGVSAAGLAGVSHGTHLLRKKLNDLNPFVRDSQIFADNFSKSLDTKDPATILKNYAIEGNKILNTTFSRKGKKQGYDIIKKIWSNPLTSLAFKGRTFDAEHYGAFKKSPIDALLKLEEEMYLQRGQESRVKAVGPKVNQDASILFDAGKKREQRMLEILKRKNPNITPEMLHTQYGDQYKRLAKSLYAEGDRVAERARAAAHSTGKFQATELHKSLAQEAKRLGIKVNGGYRGLSSLPLDIQKKILDSFFKNNNYGQAKMINDFVAGFGPAISQYRTLATTLGLYSDKSRAIQRALKFISRSARGKAIAAAGVGAAGLSASMLSNIFRKDNGNKSLEENIRKALEKR